MKNSGAPLTDEDMDEYHFQNESEILNDMAWTSIEPGVQEPNHPHNIRAISSGPEPIRLKLVSTGSLIPVLNGIMKHISHQKATFSFWENISMPSQLTRSVVDGNFFREL